MKTATIALMVLALAVVLYFLAPELSWTEDGLLFHGDRLGTPGTRSLTRATNHCAANPVPTKNSCGPAQLGAIR